MNKTKLITWIVTISTIVTWNSIGGSIFHWLNGILVKVGLPTPIVNLILLLLPLILFVEIVTKLLFITLALPTVKFTQVTASSWSSEDRDELQFYTLELEQIGFVRLTDYTISDSSRQCIARLFAHPQQFCFAEIGRVDGLPMFCTVSCQLEKRWLLSVTNLSATTKPSAISYAFLRKPRNLSKRIENASIDLMYRALLDWREQVYDDLCVRPIEDVSTEMNFDIQHKIRIETRNRLLRKSIIWGIIEMWLFGLNPQSEWMGEYSKYKVRN
jgi:hypothetical protein